MIIPVRCFTCGKLIADKYEKYQKFKKEGKPIEEVWDILGINRLCCKRMLVSNVDIVQDILKFPRLQ
jgi:DNA-directed RNA polymerase subunit N (RpoN/RPB10)